MTGKRPARHFIAGHRYIVSEKKRDPVLSESRSEIPAALSSDYGCRCIRGGHRRPDALRAGGRR